MKGEKYVLLQNIIQGKKQAEGSTGRRRISWLHILRKWSTTLVPLSCLELQRLQVKIAMMITSLLTVDGTKKKKKMYKIIALLSLFVQETLFYTLYHFVIKTYIKYLSFDCLMLNG